MTDGRWRIEIDLPVLSDFELDALKRLRSASPAPTSFEDLCRPRTPQNLSYMSRLIGLGLVVQSNHEREGAFLTLSYIGEQVLEAIKHHCESQVAAHQS